MTPTWTAAALGQVRRSGRNRVNFEPPALKGGPRMTGPKFGELRAGRPMRRRATEAW